MMANRRFSNRSLGNLKGVRPELVIIATEALNTSPVDFVVIEGLRTEERQAELVASGASQTMNSRHLTGHAIDVAALDSNYQISWHWPLYDVLAKAFKDAANKYRIALVWGGDWTSLRDGPHYELKRSVYPT